MKIQILQIIAFLLVIACVPEKSECKLLNKDVEAQVVRLDNNQLAYLIKKDGQVVVDTSLLGIILAEKTLGANSKIKRKECVTAKFDYPLLGVKNKAQHQATISTFEMEETDGFTWVLEFQVSEEGVAFRYKVPGDVTQTVKGELSSFRFPNKTTVWYFERNNDWKLKSHAGEWLSADISAMPTVSKMGPVQGLTLTCELPNKTYAVLAEATLFNYSGMRLEAIGNNTFKANFTEGDKGFDVECEIVTPWRCVLLADNLNELVNNSFVASLNPKPDEKLFGDQSWIKPGKAAWYWFTGSKASFDEEMKTADYAAKLGFQYTMVDEGWEDWENKWDAITKLCKHAQSKSIGIFLWKHSKQINFPENNYAVMAGFLDSVKQTGAVGVKVDFMNGETKSLIDFDEALLKLAAERKLMVNFHGCQQSSGEYRTYPNEVSREGIRGIELNNMKEGPLTASHNAALPFTRYVTGHADYTPIAFSAPGETSWAQQLATLVCYYSTFQCIAENPEYLLKSDRIKPALNFIKEVPTVWDETIVLPESNIGKLAVMARRKGTDWYLGIISSGPDRELTLNCNFLSGENYRTELFADDKNAEPINLDGLNPRANLTKNKTVIPFKKVEMTSNKNTILKLDLATNGGAVIWFKSL